VHLEHIRIFRGRGTYPNENPFLFSDKFLLASALRLVFPINVERGANYKKFSSEEVITEKGCSPNIDELEFTYPKKNGDKR
jgi:hypothetical protein